MANRQAKTRPYCHLPIRPAPFDRVCKTIIFYLAMQGSGDHSTVPARRRENFSLLCLQPSPSIRPQRADEECGEVVHQLFPRPPGAASVLARLVEGAGNRL